ncbi:MAG: mechanosensitive ion channel domain-containing protein [Steroidobacteraceae bacterium]|jgi:small-conductance mechanosensitive channel
MNWSEIHTYSWDEFQKLQLLGNSPRDWLVAALAFLLALLVLPVLRRFLHARIHREGLKPATVLALIANLIEHTSRMVVWVAALYLAERLLKWPHKVDEIFDVIIVVGIWLQMGLWLIAATRFGLMNRPQAQPEPRLAGTIKVVMFVVHLVVWAMVLLLALVNLNIKVTGLLAGLGVGGIALALAVQTVLGDLFASLAIVLDQPFVPGDMLTVGDCTGSVEQIGIKSTRLRSVTGEQVIIANAELLKSRVRNFGRMREQRGLFTLMISYETPPEKIARVSIVVEQIIQVEPGVRFDHCLLTVLGERALQFEVLFYNVIDAAPAQEVLLDRINRKLLERLAAEGILLAYPLNQVYLREKLVPVADSSGPRAPAAPPAPVPQGAP